MNTITTLSSQVKYTKCTKRVYYFEEPHRPSFPALLPASSPVAEEYTYLAALVAIPLAALM